MLLKRVRTKTFMWFVNLIIQFLLKYFIAKEVYLLCLCILPYKLVDSSDLIFVKYSSTPIVSSLNKSLNIKMYNERWFHTKPDNSPPPPHYYTDIPLSSSILELISYPPVRNLCYKQKLTLSHKRK